jgi:hypothetical protein
MGAAAWSWDDVVWDTPPRRMPAALGGNKRPHGHSLSRFVGTAHHANREGAALSVGHAAVTGARTLFPRSVVRAAASPRLLVSGFNSAKIGARVMKGSWTGLPIFTLTLEERATCPSSCALWRECFGNAMPFARRHAHGPDLIARLDADLRELAARHRDGFVVRVHVLGDFWSIGYLMAWFRWVRDIPGLRVFGYTAHAADSDEGAIIQMANALWPDRCAIRFSVAPEAAIGPMQATTIWRKAGSPWVPEGLVCPAQQDRTQACATCGLCWSPAMADTRIVFVGHGMNRFRGRVMPSSKGALQ